LTLKKKSEGAAGSKLLRTRPRGKRSGEEGGKVLTPFYTCGKRKKKDNLSPYDGRKEKTKRHSEERLDQAHHFTTNLQGRGKREE